MDLGSTQRPRPEALRAHGEINPALDAIVIFSEVTHSERALDHPQRVERILRDFVGDMLTDPVFDAALLHDLADRIRDPLMMRNARNALQAYNSSPSIPEGRKLYAFCLLSDLETVEQTAEAYRFNIEDEDPKFIEYIQEGSKNAVPKDFWLKKASMVDPDLMSGLLEEVNIESVLIKVAEMLDNLHNPSPKKESSLLQDINEAEAFYAPLCELLGFDGMAMALRDTVSGIRFKKSGDQHLVDKAKEVLDTIKSLDDVEAIFSTIFGLGNFVISKVVGDVSDAHKVLIGDLITEGDIESKGAWRVKSLGSYCSKLRNNGGIAPMDVLGITLIANDLIGVRDLFFRIVELVKSKPDQIKPKPSDKRTTPAVIKGDDEFLGIFDGHDLEGLATVKKTKPGAYRVAKFTMMVTTTLKTEEPKEVPVEIQITTHADRINNRIGSASHVVYKGGVVKNVGALGSIYERRARLQKKANSLNERSMNRARTLRKLVGVVAS